MNILTYIVLAIAAIWLFVELLRAMVEELIQTSHTVIFKHVSYFTRERGTGAYWLQDLHSMVLLLLFCVAVVRFMPVEETYQMALASVYLSLGCLTVCFLATAIWWRWRMVRELRNLESNLE